MKLAKQLKNKQLFVVDMEINVWITIRVRF